MLIKILIRRHSIGDVGIGLLLSFGSHRTKGMGVDVCRAEAATSAPVSSGCVPGHVGMGA